MTGKRVAASTSESKPTKKSKTLEEESSNSQPKKPSTSKSPPIPDTHFAEQPIFANEQEEEEIPILEIEEQEDEQLLQVLANGAGTTKLLPAARKCTKHIVQDDTPQCRFLGDSVADEEARRRWPHRYQGESHGKKVVSCNGSTGKDGTEEIIKAKNHYLQAEVDGRIVCNLLDDAHVNAEEGKDYYICRIVEFFEAVDGTPYFTAQWFYRACDTVIQNCCNLIDDKRVFLSEIKDDNPLDCLVEKLKIVQVPLNVESFAREAAISNCNYYYDTMYMLPYSSFVGLPPPDNMGHESESDSTISSEVGAAETVGGVKISQLERHKENEMSLLDIYSGCGAMSTGLCLGANSNGVNLVTKWAVDLNPYACKSLKLNHPETEVRNESAEDFLSLLKEWEKLCASFSLIGSEDSEHQCVDPSSAENDEGNDDDQTVGDDGEDGEVFEVEEVVGICFGDPNEIKKPGLYLKIRWKGYGPEEDTWEPTEGLEDCPDKIKEFVKNGYKLKILPLPDTVDVICGGPPCQGISGFNRFRNKENPLEDPKNKQLVVFMNIVNFLKPRFVLMENVVDIVKFAGGFLGRYALSSLVGMNYQARLGMMAAGAYGLPQFRMRVFLWGAHPKEKLPQYPLPTHNVVVRGVIPIEFESNTVGHEEHHKIELEKELFLGDAILDLPPVENDEARDEMPYEAGPETTFQHFIRLRKDEMPGCSSFGSDALPHQIFDHRPLQLNGDDYQRVCQIPMRKGANFRDLAGVRVREDNKVEWDPNVSRVYLPSGKPLVPDYAMSFVFGRSTKPFARLWWDETVPTVVTRAEPHNQAILHPLQNRVLTIRENARLQGFPDYYKLIGPIKERYIQVGNAVAVPVARALGHALALALKGSCGENPLFLLPAGYPTNMVDPLSPASDRENV